MVWAAAQTPLREVIRVVQVDPNSCYHALPLLVFLHIMRFSFCCITLQAAGCAMKVAKVTMPATWILVHLGPQPSISTTCEVDLFGRADASENETQNASTFNLPSFGANLTALGRIALEQRDPCWKGENL